MARKGVPIYGLNSAPLEPWEQARWAKLEEDEERRAWRDRPHVARMVRGLGLCASCYGFVHDFRHTSIGTPVDLRRG